MKPGGESYNEAGFFRDLSGIILRALVTGAGMRVPFPNPLPGRVVRFEPRFNIVKQVRTRRIHQKSAVPLTILAG